MTLGRIFGAKVRDRYPHQLVIVGSGAFCIVVLAVVLGSTSLNIVFAGLWSSGIGLSNFILMLFSSVGRLALIAGMPASKGLAITTRMAYVGLLGGLLVISPIAQVIGRRISMVMLAIAVSITCVGWLVLSRISSGKPWVLHTPDRRRITQTSNT